jgi:DNA-binding transcriptional ArsR family regulator
LGLKGTQLKAKNSTAICAERLRTLADPERLQIIRALRERPQCVSDIAALLDNEIGNVSHHLKVLRKNGFVTFQRQGKSIIYSLSLDVFPTSNCKNPRFDLGCCSLEFTQ